MFEYYGWGILLKVFWNDGMSHICTSFGQYHNFVYDVMLTLVILSKNNNFTRWSNSVIYIYIYICNIFFHAKIYTNDYFYLNYFSKKGGDFVLTLYFARKTDEVEHQLCISSNDEFQGVLISNCLIFLIYAMLSNTWITWCG